MRYTFRPLPVWPYESTPSSARRSRWTFKAGWDDTIDLLGYEIERLNGRAAIIAAGFSEYDIRQDGMPRANARQPSHPGVEVSFDTSFGRLVYATDICELWQHNVRSIALGLEALRAVDRFGISKRGQQYAGFALLAAGEPLEAHGAKLVERFGSVAEALRHTHPDTRDGDMTDRDFQAVVAYRERQKTVVV